MLRTAAYRSPGGAGPRGAAGGDRRGSSPCGCDPWRGRGRRGPGRAGHESGCARRQRGHGPRTGRRRRPTMCARGRAGPGPARAGNPGRGNGSLPAASRVYLPQRGQPALVPRAGTVLTAMPSPRGEMPQGVEDHAAHVRAESPVRRAAQPARLQRGQVLDGDDRAPMGDGLLDAPSGPRPRPAPWSIRANRASIRSPLHREPVGLHGRGVVAAAGEQPLVLLVQASPAPAPGACAAGASFAETPVASNISGLPVLRTRFATAAVLGRGGATAPVSNVW
jgi:hypothetical protein